MNNQGLQSVGAKAVIGSSAAAASASTSQSNREFYVKVPQ